MKKKKKALFIDNSKTVFSNGYFSYILEHYELILNQCKSNSFFKEIIYSENK